MDILDQVKQSIEANKSEHPTVTLAMTFHKPVGEANMYVWFEEGPQKIYNHTRGQVSGSTNAEPINTKKKSTTKNSNTKTETPRDNTLKYNVGQNQP